MWVNDWRKEKKERALIAPFYNGNKKCAYALIHFDRKTEEPAHWIARFILIEVINDGLKSNANRFNYAINMAANYYIGVTKKITRKKNNNNNNSKNSKNT